MFFKTKATRDRLTSSSNSFVADLDKLVADPIPFKWMGKAHFIKPMELDTFLKTMGSMKSFDEMMHKAKTGQIEFDECVGEIHNLISSCCDSISKGDVLKMTISQVNALMNLIIKSVTGQSGSEKKSPVVAESNTTNPSLQ